MVPLATTAMLCCTTSLMNMLPAKEITLTYIVFIQESKHCKQGRGFVVNVLWRVVGTKESFAVLCCM